MTNRHAKWPLAGVLSGLVILACGTTPTEAHPGRRVAPIERRALQEQLGLTEDQVQAIREIHARHRESMRETVRALREARRALRDMALGEPDEATFTPRPPRCGSWRARCWRRGSARSRKWLAS